MELGQMVNKQVTVSVEPEDLTKAERGTSLRCAVMQAIARTIPDAHHIDIDTQTIRFTQGDQRYIYVTPARVVAYVVAFDAGEPLWPFKFQLRQARSIQAKRELRTDVGKAIDNARKRVKRKAEKIGKSPKAADYQAAYAEAQIPEEARTDVGPGRKAVVPRYIETPGDGPAPPRVFKSKERIYGMRAHILNAPGKEADRDKWLTPLIPPSAK